MADKKTYEVTGTLYRDGNHYAPGDPIELTDQEAEELMERSPSPIQEPEAGSAPAPPSATTHPLAPQTIAETKAILPEIGDVDRLEAALEVEETQGGTEAIQKRIDELAEDKGE